MAYQHPVYRVKARRYCRTCREFSWLAYHQDGVGYCELYRVDTWPTDDASQCDGYQFDREWRDRSASAYDYALELKRLLYP
jgi:hypothetical protein